MATPHLAAAAPGSTAQRPGPLLRIAEQGTAGVFFTSRFLDGANPTRSVTAESERQSPPDRVHETGESSVFMRDDLNHQATLWGKWGVVAASFVPSLPEPSTCALMLAGVAGKSLNGCLACQRRIQLNQD